MDVVWAALFKPRGAGLGEMTDRASLASATSTRIDSGCKHIQQCRVSQDHMQKLAKNGGDDLFTNKFGYAVHKDEMVLAVRDHWYMKDKQYSENAYPRVISNLGRIADKTSTGAKDPPEVMKFMLWMYHNVEHVKDRDHYITWANEMDANGFKEKVTGVAGVVAGAVDWFTLDSAGTNYAFKAELSLLYDFSFVGFANTLGYAHAHHGDTMTSVHIGGLRTVMNGDYSIRCGDKLQWYWPDEAHLFFDNKGKRVTKYAHASLLNPPSGGGMGSRPQGVTDREEFHTLQFGQTKDKQKYVPRIKAYVEDPECPRLYDYMRVFAVAISSARPHEMFDIMIARQAL